MKLMLVAVLSSLSVVISAEREIICSSGPVEAVCDQDVTLQCHLEPPLDATDMTVKWSQVHNNNTVHLYQNRRDNPAEQKEHYEGRTSLSHEGLTKGNLSLKLSSVKPNDAGRYRCSFQSDELQKSCYVNLTVAVTNKSTPSEGVIITIIIVFFVAAAIVIVTVLWIRKRDQSNNSNTNPPEENVPLEKK